MTIGTGILLSSLFLGMVALFIATKDRWNWKKIVVRSLLGLMATVAIVGGGFYAWLEYEQRPPKPAPISELWDIPLSASKGDIKFLKGEPHHIRVVVGIGFTAMTQMPNLRPRKEQFHGIPT